MSEIKDIRSNAGPARFTDYLHETAVTFRDKWTGFSVL